MREYFSGAWRRLRHGKPGRRFQDQKDHHGGGRDRPTGWQRAATAVLGAALVVAGVVLLALPGPGLLVSALGLVLLSQSVTVVGAFLDRCELRLRELGSRGRVWWARASTGRRLVSVGLLATLAAPVAYLVYHWLFG
jgi:hypothetical protein